MQPVDDVLKLHYFSESYVISSPGDENETKHLEALEGAEKCLRLFQIDLLDYPSILAAINGCAGVFHLASPCIVDEVREPEIDQKVQREIINHRSLRHPNIVRFKEVLLTPTHLAIVMEYAAGGELFEKICNAGRFSEDEARFFFQQLISGVSYCHSMQICHRDLKLENTLLDENTTFAELTGNDIFKGDVPPSSAEKAISTAKMREMSGSNIFADGKAEPRDYLGGVRQPPGGDSSIFLV